MLVIVSDLHLTDGTTNQTIKEAAFRVLRQRLRDLAYDASWRADGKYRPIESMDILLLGDILDVIRSTKWSDEGSPKPWDDPSSPAFIDKIKAINGAILEENVPALKLLKELDTGDLTERITLPPAKSGDKPAEVGWEPDATDRRPVQVHLHYMIGNHDWFYHLRGAAYDAIRQSVVEAIGLTNVATEPFPHDPSESPTIERLFREHGLFARHGDIYDSFNFAGQRDQSTLGDALVVELMNSFPEKVKQRIGRTLPPNFATELKEIDNVRPSLTVPIWVESLLQRTTKDYPDLGPGVRQVWNEMVDQFLSLDFVREQDTLNPFDDVDKLSLVLKITKRLPLDLANKPLNWIRKRTWGGAVSYHEHALKEKAFQQGEAQFIVYGHTHHHEIVPLSRVAAVGQSPYVCPVYLNSGTWRPVHQLAVPESVDKQFANYIVMTYFAFFKDDERGGRPYESWFGTLGVPPASLAAES